MVARVRGAVLKDKGDGTFGPLADRDRELLDDALYDIRTWLGFDISGHSYVDALRGLGRRIFRRARRAA
jgi:hypothetical protein